MVTSSAATYGWELAVPLPKVTFNKVVYAIMVQLWLTTKLTSMIPMIKVLF
jgi:hypothetical protein